MSDARAGRVGTTIDGKWRIDARIGSGGMATVYSATHRNGARAAIKMLHAQLSRDASTRARFLREGYAANSIRHPGVVKVLDDGVAEDGSAFLVLELLEGETLDRRRERLGGTLPLEEVLHFADQALDALAAAHRSGVIHRDVKPENLFVTNDVSIKLLDFGLARMKHAEAETTKTGITIGTPEFMPPEQALGRRDAVDARSDVWGMGATLFNAITGRYVHEEAHSVRAQLVASATQRPRPLRQVAPHVPPAIAKVIDRALELEMDDRWSSAVEMQDALRAARLPDAPVASSRPASSRRPPVTSGKTVRVKPYAETLKRPVVSFEDADIEETYVDPSRRPSPRGGVPARDPGSDHRTSRVPPSTWDEPGGRGPGSSRGRGPESPRRPDPSDAARGRGPESARGQGPSSPRRSSAPVSIRSAPPASARRASFVPAPPVDAHGAPLAPPARLTPEEAMEPTIAGPISYLPTPRPHMAQPAPPSVRGEPLDGPRSARGYDASLGPSGDASMHPAAPVSRPMSPSSPQLEGNVPRTSSPALNVGRPSSPTLVANRAPTQTERRSPLRITVLVGAVFCVLCLAMAAYVLWQSGTR